MKVLKSRALMVLLAMAFVITFTLAIVITLPARPAPANAEEVVYTETVNVSSEEALKNAVKNAATTPTKIILDDDIEMNSITSKENKKFYELTVNRDQVIELDLAGHILSLSPASIYTRGVIQNYGTLSIVDSSNNYSGAVVSNGYIHTEKDGNVYWDASKSVIDNYGALTLNANVRMGCPAPTTSGTDGYFNRICYISQSALDSHLIRNLMEPPMSSDPDQTFYVASVTINGGNFDLDYSSALKNKFPYVMDHFILIRDAQLTINGGTFRNSQTHCYEGIRPWNPGFLVDLGYLSEGYGDENNKKLLEGGYRHVNININGGDFGDKNLLTTSASDNALLYLAEYNKSKYGDSYSVSISGGKFPFDLSAYTDAEHMMKENDDGTYGVVIVDDDYIKEYAVAKLLLDDGESTLSGYYGSFEGAWNAAKTLAQMGQSTIIQLLKDTESKILYLEGVKNDVSITLDLNGKELKISVEGQNASWDNAFICADNSTSEPGITTLVVCDKTEGQNGAINFAYPDKYDKYGSIYITQHMRFVLESGTLKRTGGGFSEAKGNSEYKKSIFYLNNAGAYNVHAVTIKGGNILSMLSGDDQGHLISKANCSGHNEESWYELTEYTNDLILDFDAYLNSPEKGCQFSWDLKSILPQNYKCAEDKNTNTYYVSLVGDSKYLVGTQSFTLLSTALEAAKTGDKTVLMIAPDEATEAIELDGIILDLNTYQKFTLKVMGGLTLTNGAAIKNGTISGDITVEGPASFSNFELQGNLTVKGEGLEITEGTYNGTVTVEDGAKLSISGGSFLGSQVETIEKYTPQYYGMFKLAKDEYVDDTLYPVRVAPNAAVRKWYTETFVVNNYTINSATDWNNFALVVSSGADNFSGKMIKLGQSIDFSKNAEGVALFGATATEPNFLPAGTNAYRFAGSFDGQGNTMSGIYAQEINVGLFGATAYHHTVRVMNIIVENSTFISGRGRFDTFNTGATPAVGAIVGEGHLDGGKDGEPWSGRITLSGVTIGHEAEGQYFTGGVVGHSWGDVYLDGLTIKNKTTLQHAWKMGGVVGYLEGSFYIKKADIEQGKEPDGSDNGLILEGNGRGYVGALIGHANGPSNTIEDCTILEHKDSLIGTTYAGGQDGTITIKGSETHLDIYRVVGEGLADGEERRNPVDIQITGEVTDEGVSNGSFKTHKAEDYLTFTDGEGNEIEPETNADGGYETQATVRLTVTVFDIKVAEGITYGEHTIDATSFKLKTSDGKEISTIGLTLTVTLKESSVGTQVALITALSLGGEDAANYTLALAGQPAFMEITVNPATLYVKANPDGTVTYEGFVGNDDESVLSGELVLERNGNVLTPSGLTSENYNIIYVSSTLGETVDLTALWIALAVVGAAVVAGGCVLFLRRKKN